MTRPVNSIDVLNDARWAANALRAEWLMSITDGLVTATDLVNEACKDDGAPLRKISLQQLLLSQTGWGVPTVQTRLQLLLSLISTNGSSSQSWRDLTVGWLVDGRDDGRRFAAWAEISAPQVLPWSGFPLRRRPDGVAAR